MSLPATGNIKRSVTIRGHRTSVTLEQAFWESLRDIAAAKGRSVNALIADIDAADPRNLSSAIRVFVLEHYKPRERVERVMGIEPT